MLPCEVTEVAVGGASDHFAVDGTKLLNTITERYNLSWTHKRAKINTNVLE